MAGREEGERNHKDTKITKETRREREAPAETMIRKEKPRLSICLRVSVS